jgi:hypothetical protein
MTASATTPAPAANAGKLSTVSIIAIAAAAILVLAGLGIAVGASAESDVSPRAPRAGHRIGVASSFSGGRGRGVQLDAPSSVTADARRQPTHLQATSGSVPLGDSGVVVPIPAGWQYKFGDTGLSLAMWNGSSYAFVNPYVPAVKPDPSTVVAGLLQDWVINVSGNSQVKVSDVLGWTGIDGAYQDYIGIHTDDNGSYGIGGELNAVIRDDGHALAIQLETYGSTTDDAWTKYQNDQDLQDILHGSVNSFASAG